MRHNSPQSPTAAALLAALPAAYHEARLAYRQGHIERSRAALAPLLAAAGPVPRPAILLNAWCLIEQKRPQEARTFLQSAQDGGDLPADDLTAAVIRLNARLYTDNMSDIQRDTEQLLARCQEPADLNHAELRLILGATLRGQGQLAEAMHHVEFACSAFTVLSEPGRCAVAANFLGWTCLSRGCLHEARRWFEKSLGLNTQHDISFRAAQNYQNLAIVCYKQGDYQLAVELLEKELALVDSHPDMICRALIALGNVRRLRGEFGPARTVLLEAFALAEEQQMKREQALALEFLGDVFRDEGHPSQARTYYSRGLVIARELAPQGDLVMELTRRRGECLDRQGYPQEAEVVLHKALEMCCAAGDKFETAVTRRCLGVNAKHLGRWQQSRKQLELALAELQSVSARHETMLAAYELSLLLSEHGDPGLDQAWHHGLHAQRLSQELNTPAHSLEITTHLAELARRRLASQTTTVTAAHERFSSRSAPASRVIVVSRSMQETLRRCDSFARYDTPTLLLGEHGTGKELLARRLHENSSRSAGSLVTMTCSEIPETQQAAHLFGDAEHNGLLARATGGTLVIKGIENLSDSVQTRLLRILQDGIYQTEDNRRHDLRANIRTIVTSAADLGHLAEQCRFRQDLYFRLRLMSLRVPPLRERVDDIVPLMGFFLGRLEGSTLSTRAVLGIPGLAVLTDHRWPDNATEVKDLAQRIWLARHPGQIVRLTKLRTAAGIRLDVAASEPAPGHPSGLTHAGLTALIARAQGNKSRTARNLGVSRVTLYRWLRQLEGGSPTS